MNPAQSTEVKQRGRNELVVTRFVHCEQMKATVQRVESIITLALDLRLRTDLSLTSARRKSRCMEWVKEPRADFRLCNRSKAIKRGDRIESLWTCPID